MNEAAYPKVYLYRRIVQAKLFIDNNYQENIDLGNIADEAYFSKFHFIRQFRKIYKQTPHQYLKALRIQKAMLLLRMDRSVSDVCYYVGFESLSSFSALFKRTVGVSPSTYLIQQRELRSLMMKAPLAFVPGCHAQKNGWM